MTKSIAIIILIFVSVDVWAINQHCDYTLTKSRSGDSYRVGGPTLNDGGATWTYTDFEPGKFYRFCFTLPIVDIGRRPSFRKFRDMLLLDVESQSVMQDAEIHAVLISPGGRRYETLSDPDSRGSSKVMAFKYTRKGKWVLEFMVRGYNRYGFQLTEMMSRPIGK